MATPDETKKGMEGAPLATGQSSLTQTGTTPQTEGTFTKSEVTKLISDLKASEGREKAALTKQINLLTNQLTTVNSDLEEANRNIEKLAKDDPDKKQFVALTKELTLKKKEFEAQIADYGEDVKTAKEFRRERMAEAVAAKYKDGDAGKLKTLSAALNLTSEEQITAIATGFWTLHESPVIPKTDSGGTTGGGKATFTRKQIADMSPDEYKKNYDSIHEAQLASKIK